MTGKIEPPNWKGYRNGRLNCIGEAAALILSGGRGGDGIGLGKGGGDWRDSLVKRRCRVEGVVFPLRWFRCDPSL